MRNERRRMRPVRWWRDKQRVKPERTGPSGEAQHEQRNADKVVDPMVVAKNARRMFPPWTVESRGPGTPTRALACNCARD
jgi:hypothetical protein